MSEDPYAYGDYMDYHQEERWEWEDRQQAIGDELAARMPPRPEPLESTAWVDGVVGPMTIFGDTEWHQIVFSVISGGTLTEHHGQEVRIAVTAAQLAKLAQWALSSLEHAERLRTDDPNYRATAAPY